MSTRVIVRFFMRSGQIIHRDFTEYEARDLVKVWINPERHLSRLGESSLPGFSSVWGINLDGVDFIDVLDIELYQRQIQEQNRKQQEQNIFGNSGRIGI